MTKDSNTLAKLYQEDVAHQPHMDVPPPAHYSAQKYKHIALDKNGVRVDLMRAIAHQPRDVFKMFKTQTTPKAWYVYLNKCNYEAYIVLQSILIREYVSQRDLEELDKILINLDLDGVREAGGEIDSKALHYKNEDVSYALLGYRAMGLVTAIDMWITENDISTDTIEPLLEYRSHLVKYISTQTLADLNKARTYQVPETSKSK